MSFKSPLFFLATEIINPFLDSMISANHDKVEAHSANGKILIKRIVALLCNLFCCDFAAPLNMSPQISN